MQIWALIIDSFRESRDRKIFWGMLLLSLATVGMMACVAFEPGKVTFFFGAWEIESSFFTEGAMLRKDTIAALAVEQIADSVLGTIGVMLALISTAGFFPGLMERGGIDSVLAKPLSRSALFLGKYLGAMMFMLFHATLFVTLSFLVIGFQWGVWLPNYLWFIPLMVLLFSYLYCISALAAVLFRNSILAALLSIGAWMGFAGVQLLDDVFVDTPSWQEYQMVYRGVHTARWICPKTSDITMLAKEMVGAAKASTFVGDDTEADEELLEFADRVEKRRREVSPLVTIGSSLMFEGVIVFMAIWVFNRRDF